MTSFVLRGGTIVDGTGAPRVTGDVRVENGRIVEVGKVESTGGTPVLDVSGLVVAPGFIDAHTHYDAQITWDRALSSSSAHGVTSVVMGNCGYSIAPVRQEGRSFLIKTLEAVEGMSAEALEAGIRWDFETYPEYLASLEGDIRLNVGGLVGHTALRAYVMGGAASERAATEEEVRLMTSILRDALDCGALGFSTSLADNGAYGKPVPPRFADLDEMFALARVFHDRERGVIQLVPPSPGTVTDFAPKMADASGKPVTFVAVLTGLYGGSGAAVACVDEYDRLAGDRVIGEITNRPIVFQFNLADPMAAAHTVSPTFLEALQLPVSERAGLYAQPDWRERTRAAISERYQVLLAKATIAQSSRHPELVSGPTLGELAASRGVEPLDVLVDLSLEDNLATRVQMTLMNDDDDEITQLLNDDRCLVALSDAGAHMNQICDMVYTTDLLSRWVRDKQAISLERAVWMMTRRPAEVFGISNRGVIQPGYAADLVAFDPATVKPRPAERRWDLPGGADRLIADSEGMLHVWVNGVQIRENDSEIADVRPGQVVRC